MENQTKQMKVKVSRLIERLRKNTLVQLILRTAEGAGNHDVAHRAAAVAYYGFLSVFPLLLGLIAILGYLLPSVNLQEQLLKFIGENIPGATTIVVQNIDSIIRSRGAVGLLSVIIFFWGASGMFSAMSLAINRAYDISKHRPFFIRKARELGMAFSTGILFLLSLGISALISFSNTVFHIPATDLAIVNIGSKAAAFMLMLAVFLLLYKTIPNTKTYWRYVWPGALLATIFFEIARTLFIVYIENFANYQLIYGSITSVIVLLIWTYYSAFILILGAEFTYQFSRSRLLATAGRDAGKPQKT
jgi:membrane protein